MSDQKNQDKETDQKPIVHLTDAALEKIKSMMKRDGKEKHYLRIGVVAGVCAGMSYDLRLQKTPYDNDIQWEQGGVRVITNPESIQFMHGTEINYVDTLKESGFQYKNPNASGSCGCGTSFS
jgi:iron-sulfur cluster assembly accessory protein